MVLLNSMDSSREGNRDRVKEAPDLNTPAVLSEHFEANGRPKDCKHQHEDDVLAHLPDVRHQVEHPAHYDQVMRFTT